MRTATTRTPSREEETRTISEYLPRHSYVNQVENVAGIDSYSFLQYSQLFVKDVEDLTAGGRKVLLVYDGCRSHLGYKVPETLDRGSAIALALPVHTGGVTLPLEDSVVPQLKSRLSDLIKQNFSNRQSG